MSETFAVEMKNITKVYPDGTIALRNVDFSVRRGEIHGVLGENGAGKTTLMRILYGEIKPTLGKIKIFGRPVFFRGPWDAMKSGIAMVYQHFSLIPTFTVLENLILSTTSLRKVPIENVKRIAREVSEELGLKVSLEDRIENLPVGVQQKIEIIKALMRGAKIIILDEPTSVLTPIEVSELFEILKKLKENGITIIFITHKLKEVKEISDRVTVLRKGHVVGTVNSLEVSELELAKMMIGRNISFDVIKPFKKAGSEILKVEDLWVKDDRGLTTVKGVNLSLREGEILGLAGIQGNGQRELVEAIVGIRKPEKGKVLFLGEDVTGKPPALVYNKGISYIPDSRAVGLVLEHDLISNSILTRLKKFLGKGSRILWKRARDNAMRIVKDFNIVTDSLKSPVKYLSGGNQQRALVGREIIANPRLIIACEPTHGLDVAATSYIRDLLIKLKNEGKAILLVSTDLDEIFQLSDRLAVICDGKIVGEGKPSDFTPERIGLLMGGG